MASLLSAIGATASPSARVGIPIAAHGVRGLFHDLRFAAQLDLKLQDATDGSDALSAIAGLLQTGTPMATIVNHIASQISKEVAKATGSGGNADRQNTLKRALVAALAPPGTSPPGGSGAEQAAALVQRLRQVLTKLTGELKSAGQQSRFSGQVLDANSAREIPAQQTKSATTGTQPAASDLLVESILADAVTSLSQPPVITARTGTPQPQAPQSQAPQTQARDVQLVVQQSNALQSFHEQTPIQIQDQNQNQGRGGSAAPDLLSRMLTRAANADARINGSSLISGTPAASIPTHPNPVPVTSAPNSAALFERLIEIVAQTAGANSDASGKNSQNPTPQNGGSPAAAQAFQLPAPTASAPAQAATPIAQNAAPYPSVDPHAVIEQLVQGIVMRNSGSTSEVRLRLQPEHLGDVSLKLTVTGNTVNANIIAQNPHVRDVLLANQQQLSRSFQNAGLSLGSFSVDVSGGNSGFTQRQAQQQRQTAKVAFGAVPANEDGMWTETQFGPPLITASKSLVLNYLA